MSEAKKQQAGIQRYIQKNYREMFECWSMRSANGFYVGK